jgi:hypothetical protein
MTAARGRLRFSANGLSIILATDIRHLPVVAGRRDGFDPSPRRRPYLHQENTIWTTGLS